MDKTSGVKVDTKTALLACPQCKKATEHTFKQAKPGEVDSYRTNQGVAMRAKTYYLLFGCCKCEGLRLWGTSVKKTEC